MSMFDAAQSTMDSLERERKKQELLAKINQLNGAFDEHQKRLNNVDKEIDKISTGANEIKKQINCFEENANSILREVLDFDKEAASNDVFWNRFYEKMKSVVMGPEYRGSIMALENAGMKAALMLKSREETAVWLRDEMKTIRKAIDEVWNQINALG